MHVVVAVVFFFGLNGELAVKEFVVPDPIEVCQVKATEASKKAMLEKGAMDKFADIKAVCVEVDLADGAA